MPLLPRKAKIETSIDNRKRQRHKLFLEVADGEHDTASDAVLVHDILDTGLLIETKSELGVGEIIEVNLPNVGPNVGVMMEAEIMWAGGQIYGCKFTRECTQATISAELLGARFTLTNSVAVDAVTDTPKGGITGHDSSTEGLSYARKLWISAGLVLSLGIIAAAAVFCLVFEPGSMAVMDIGVKRCFCLWEIGPPPLLKHDRSVLVKDKINRHGVRNAYVDIADAVTGPPAYRRR
jgi:hypothetical protein